MDLFVRIRFGQGSLADESPCTPTSQKVPHNLQDPCAQTDQRRAEGQIEVAHGGVLVHCGGGLLGGVVRRVCC